MKTIALLFVFLLTGLPAVLEGQGHDHGSSDVKSETVYTCPMHPEIRQSDPGICPICKMTLVPVKGTQEDQKQPKPKEEIKFLKQQNDKPILKKKELYTCSMHPQIRMSQPGSCPICGMDLVPVVPQEALPPSQVQGFSAVRINPTQQWLIGVKTEPVIKKKLTRRLRTFGSVAYDPNLYVAQKEYLEALKSGHASGTTSFIQASRRKLTLLGMTLEQIDALGKKGKVDESLFLTEGTGMAWIYSVIYESERPMIQADLNVEVRTVGHPMKKYEGKIDAILPVVDPTNRTIQVRSAVKDPMGLLKPGMFADVFIEIPLGNTLAVSRSAVLQTGLRNIVMVDKGDGIFEPREVLLGNEANEDFQILSGLQEGEQVVTGGNFLIDSESQIRGAFSNPEGEHPHGH